MLLLQACLRCGRRTEGDCLLWKGGVSRVLCPECARREEEDNAGLQKISEEMNKKTRGA